MEKNFSWNIVKHLNVTINILKHHSLKVHTAVLQCGMYEHIPMDVKQWTHYFGAHLSSKSGMRLTKYASSAIVTVRSWLSTFAAMAGGKGTGLRCRVRRDATPSALMRKAFTYLPLHAGLSSCTFFHLQGNPYFRKFLNKLPESYLHIWLGAHICAKISIRKLLTGLVLGFHNDLTLKQP